MEQESKGKPSISFQIYFHLDSYNEGSQYTGQTYD